MKIKKIPLLNFCFLKSYNLDSIEDRAVLFFANESNFYILLIFVMIFEF